MRWATTCGIDGTGIYSRIATSRLSVTVTGIYRAGALYSSQPAKGEAGERSEGVGEVSLLWAWCGLGDGDMRMARLRECARAVSGVRDSEAKAAYRQFVGGRSRAGAAPGAGGRRAGAVDGGMGGGKSQRQRKARALSDERILGSGEFVERILKEAEARIQRHTLPWGAVGGLSVWLRRPARSTEFR